VTARGFLGGGFLSGFGSFSEIATNSISVSGNENLASTSLVRWSSTTDPAGAKDTGLSRNAAGVVEINNGTAGTWRDLKARRGEFVEDLAGGTATVLTLRNSNATGTTQVQFTSAAATKSATVQLDSGGNMVFRNSNSGGANYFDAASGGTIFRNSSFATMFKIEENGAVRIGGASGPTWSSGTGDPESVVTAPQGSLFSRTDGGASTTLYVKTSGAGNTGWTAK